MARITGGITPSGVTTSRNAAERQGTGVVAANVGGGNLQYRREDGVREWIAEGLTPANAAVVEDLAIALCLIPSLTDEARAHLISEVLDWALAAQGRAVAA